MLLKPNDPQLMIQPKPEKKKISDHTHMDQNYNMKPMPHVVPPVVKGWQFLGTTVLSSPATSFDVIWTGTYQQIKGQLYISSFASNSIPRMLFGVGSIDTGGNYATTYINNAGVTGTQTSHFGMNLTSVAQQDSFWGDFFLENQSAVPKFMKGSAGYSTHVKTTAPAIMDYAGLWDDVSGYLQQLRIATYTTAASNTTGGNMGTGSYVILWGTNNN